uniref:Uncharacterized protein n=1 Tax=Lepeophtheirus salmonis TaxID=72036 RepID=A0A0K2T3S9_LEPSM
MQNLTIFNFYKKVEQLIIKKDIGPNSGQLLRFYNKRVQIGVGFSDRSPTLIYISCRINQSCKSKKKAQF